MLIKSALITFLGFSTAAVACGPPTPWDGYLGELESEQRVRDWAAAEPNRVRVDRYGTSRDGRPLLVATVSSDLQSADERPMILVVGGLDALHPAGTEYAVRLTEELLRNHDATLEEVTFLVIPRANPDGIAALMNGVHDGRRGGARRIDADRDGLLDEDGPNDLNGDGIISMMRMLDPSLEHPATHLPDPGESRLMKTPDRGEGERPTHAMFIEGTDQDGDGRIAEDGTGEVRVDRNFMHLFTEHDAASGPYPLSEPEALALAELVLDRPRIVGALVFGSHDTAVAMPDFKQKDETGGTPIGIDPGDEAMHRRLQASWKTNVGQVRSEDEDDRGSLHGWLYAHRGIPTLASTGWGRPDPTSEEADDASSEVESGEESPAASDPEAAGWLAWSDTARDGAGFVEWRAFDHPDLGPVEIGGMVAGFTLNPPASDLDGLAVGHAAFLADLAAMRPRLVIEGPEVNDLGGDVIRIRMAVRNDGRLPLRTAMARTNRAIRPLRIGLDVDLDRILQGSPHELIDGLAADGGRREVSWTIRRPDAPVEIILDDPQFGRRTIEVPTATPAAHGDDR
ncbi:MAG: hypothetical protein CMJ23_11165 [Phycisphaerae bacterium]|nr:hypothetical protein [Phycisphaerae bacterium]